MLNYRHDIINLLTKIHKFFSDFYILFNKLQICCYFSHVCGTIVWLNNEGKDWENLDDFYYGTGPGILQRN